MPANQVALGTRGNGLVLRFCTRKKIPTVVKVTMHRDTNHVGRQAKCQDILVATRPGFALDSLFFIVSIFIVSIWRRLGWSA